MKDRSSDHSSALRIGSHAFVNWHRILFRRRKAVVCCDQSSSSFRKPNVQFCRAEFALQICEYSKVSMSFAWPWLLKAIQKQYNSVCWPRELSVGVRFSNRAQATGVCSSSPCDELLHIGNLRRLLLHFLPPSLGANWNGSHQKRVGTCRMIYWFQGASWSVKKPVFLSLDGEAIARWPCCCDWGLQVTMVAGACAESLRCRVYIKTEAQTF